MRNNLAAGAAALAMWMLAAAPQCLFAQQSGSSGSGQSAPSGSSASAGSSTVTGTRRRLDCRNNANPLRRRFGCKDWPMNWEETISGDWHDARREARKFGITPSGSYYGALQGNTAGGSDNMMAYVGQLTLAADLDFDKMLKVPGMSVYFSASFGTGSNLSANLGSVFPVNPNYAVGVFLNEIYLQQQFLKGNLTLAAGRLAANYTFANVPALNYYMSFGIFPTPVSIVMNDLSYAGPPPGLEWGAQAVYDIKPTFQIAAGVFNTNPNSANNGNIFAWQQGNKGALATAQATYRYQQAPHDKGLPGQYTAGFYADSNSFAALNGTGASNNNGGVFILGQQKLYQPRDGSDEEGLTIWGSWSYSSKQLVSAMPVYCGFGFNYQGVFPGRKQDVASVGWIYGKSSKYIPQAAQAELLEVNYQWNPKPFVSITPDFQYIWNPTGTSSANALVLGVQLNFTF